MFCHVPANQVLTMHDVSNIWRVPLMMQAQVWGSRGAMVGVGGGLLWAWCGMGWLWCCCGGGEMPHGWYWHPLPTPRPTHPQTHTQTQFPAIPAQGAHVTICNILGLRGAERINTSLWKSGLADKWDNLREVGAPHWHLSS